MDHHGYIWRLLETTRIEQANHLIGFCAFSAKVRSLRFPLFFGSAGCVSIAQPVDKNVDEPQHALLPTRLVVHVAHADKGTNQIFRADVLAYLARSDRAVQQPANRSRQLVE